MSFLYFFHVPAFHFPSCYFITILIIFSFSTCVSAYFQEWLYYVLSLVLKLAALVSVQLYILSLQRLCRPLITLPSMPRCILIFRCRTRRPTHAVSNSWLMHLGIVIASFHPFAHLFLSVSYVYSPFAVLRSSFMLLYFQATYNLKCLGAVFSLLVSETIRCMRSELLQITDHPNGTIKLP